MAALCLAFLAAYWAPLQGMARVWLGNEDYSYCPLVPIASLYLLWERRAELARVETGACWKLFLPLLAALLLSLYGVLGSSGNVALPSLPLLILLLTGFCFGLPLLRRAFLPLAFLIFMVPVPSILERTLGLHLKSLSSALGGEVVRACGIPVFVSGNLIDLGGVRLQVVDACNGLRYLFPLIAIGVLYAYLFQHSTWKRVFCVAATLPIAVLVNSLRIGITGILASRYGAAAAEGFFHDFTGWVMFLVAFGFLAATGKLLDLFPPRRPEPQPEPPVRTVSEPAPGVEGRAGSAAQRGAFFTALFLLLVAGALTWSTGSLPPVRLAGGMASFPTEFSGWTGEAAPIDPEQVSLSGAEDAFGARYREPGGDQVSLYLGYRGSAFMENENFFHSPTVCLPANGMRVIEKRRRVISGDPVWGELPVTEMLLEDGGARMLVYFWFHTKSRVSHDKELNRFHLTLHALSRDNTYDMFLRPITLLAPGEPVEAGERRLDRFARDLSAATRGFIAQKAR